MADRLFSIKRRRPHIVDFYTPFVQGVDGYRIKYSATFDGVFADILTSTNIGFIDNNVNRNVIETQPTNDVRIVFDPTTYHIDDSKAFWLKLARVVGGAEVLVGAPTLVLPDAAHHGTGIVVIQGKAPATVLQLDLPRTMEDFRIVNEDANNKLFIGTEDGGSMVTILPKVGVQNIGYRGAQGSLYVQGDVQGQNTVSFSATFTLAFPR